MRRWYCILFPLLLIATVILACGESSSPGGSSPSENSTSTQPATGHLKIGQSAKVGEWQITVNAVKTSPGSDFNKPKAGNVFLLIDVTMKNISNQQQVATSLGQFKLRNQAGEELPIVIVTDVSPAPNGNVAAGSQVKGTLAYEVPKETHTFTLEVTGDILSTDQLIWDVKVG
jgi:Domain of unknown function (DUF4352)